jgi:hypothetical protein
MPDKYRMLRYLSRNLLIVYGVMRFPDNIALVRVKPGPRALSLTCSARLPKQYDLRNFLMSEQCAEMAQVVANLA